HRRLEEFPLHWQDMSQDVTQSFARLLCYGFVKRDQSPVHLPLGEIATQIAGEPGLGAGQAGGTIVTLIDFVGIVELAVMFGFAVLVVRSRVRVEIAYAEVRTAAGLNRSGVDRPIRRR